MHLIPVSIESIRIGHPLPFPLMDKGGVLLAKKDFVVDSRRTLEDFSARGDGLYIDVADYEAHHRAYVERLHGMVRDGKTLGAIARTKLTAAESGSRVAPENDKADWLDLQVQSNALLRAFQGAQFGDRLERFHAQLQRHTQRNPDGTLFALIYLSGTEPRMYSATHAMLTCVMCELAAREVLNWPPELQNLAGKVALTMNLSMTDLQDRLALQSEAPSATQRSAIDLHAANSAELLVTQGITDPQWLEAVREHHTAVPGALAARTPALRVARLVQRADMFAARLAPRASRAPVAPAAAMQACYFDENRQIDEAGAALIKAVGIYQPGSYVRLASEEVAIVVKRGLNTTTPRVAVLINRNGLPIMEPMVRDTSMRDYRITSSVPYREVKLQINLERLLALTTAAASERPW